MFGFKLTIRNNIFLQLFVIAALITGNYIVVLWYDQDLSEVEKTVDLVDRNGTYAQQIALYAGHVTQSDEERSTAKEDKSRLNDAINHFEDIMQVLKKGGVSPETRVNIGAIPAELSAGYFVALEREWLKYKKNAEDIVEKNLYLSDKTRNPAVLVAYEYIKKNSEMLLNRNRALGDAYLAYFDKKQASRDGVLQVIYLVNMVLVVLMVIYIIYNVVRPISKLNEIESIVREGNFARDIDYKRDDELGKVAKSINQLFTNLRGASDFIRSIGEGKLDTADLKLTTDNNNNDRLGAALLDMRDKMSQVAEADRQRNWASEGLAKFADIFRTSNQAEDFTYIIISNLVKYLDANQGGLFIVNDAEKEDVYLELVASYAYEKRKFLVKRIELSEGLIGETFREGGTVYMTEVPDNYVNITSGLGEANPKSVLLVPLKLNEDIYGVVELASFREFEPYQIDFVEKLGESIASTFASVKNAEQTQKLLKESLLLQEQMQAQEEEMRQNLEELMAAQEELQRSNVTIVDQKEKLEQELADAQAYIESLEEEKRVLQDKISQIITSNG
ncbi:MAG: HAMP domain-containing protein [Bacteroidetes bacterium]|nr:MAG: HAMP domain-containing protein [Bacteroidota bacterium]